MSANPEALPGWFHRHSDDDAQSGSANRKDEGEESTAASHSTTGGREDMTPVVVWEAANRMEAEIVAGRLNSENIPTIIRGEVLGSIYGLTGGTLAAASVLVPAALAKKALAILESVVEWDEGEQADSPDNSAA